MANIEMEEKQKQILLEKSSNKQKLLEESIKKREYQSTLKKEAILLQREEKLENVRRIQKANEYQNKKISEKIEQDKLKGDMI